ncbi:conjugative transfer protein MobI(A/C) [Vibrio cholerae]
MQKIIDAIYDEIDGLYTHAEMLRNSWMHKVAEREMKRTYIAGQATEKTTYEMRVEFSGISFRIRWLEVGFIRTGGRTIRLTKSIACPDSGRYKMSQFKKANEWELLLIDTIEQSMGNVRVKLKHLGKCHNSVVWADKVNKKPTITTKEMKYRVERKDRSIKKIKQSMM